MQSWLATDTFWLNVTNVALGLVALVPVLAVIALALAELRTRAKMRARAAL
jgi:hypothetical protein